MLPVFVRDPRAFWRAMSDSRVTPPIDGSSQVSRHALAFLELGSTPTVRRIDGNEARHGNGAKTRVPLPSVGAGLE